MRIMVIRRVTTVRRRNTNPTCFVRWNDQGRLTCVSSLGANTDDRAKARQAVYETCRGADTQPRSDACDSPVGQANNRRDGTLD